MGDKKDLIAQVRAARARVAYIDGANWHYRSFSGVRTAIWVEGSVHKEHA